MLYEKFTTYAEVSPDADFFQNKADEKTEITRNLNPAFLMRAYQKEALGRLCYYCEAYQHRQEPIHLLFNMATGSGKTLIMAASMLYLYMHGYRNFIFFTRLGNIIQKTKANFLDPHSKKYLFANKIVLDGREITIQAVDNFEGVDDENIHIVFTTIANLHRRFNVAKENAITYDDISDKKIVLLGDEAHNFQAQTAQERTDYQNWERTIVGARHKFSDHPGILHAHSGRQNILLEFTATARFDDGAIRAKYEDKAIYRYALKEYRLDGFSKDVRTVQINAPLMERALSAVIISQYRRKVAETHKIALKPVIMFKANRITPPKQKIDLRGNDQRIVVSSEFKSAFHKRIARLSVEHMQQQTRIADETLQRAFAFFEAREISLENLVAEIKSDFAPEKCLSVDEQQDVERQQILLNSLEDKNNEIRAVFATDKLNEGWDVLNLFDIVRLYNTRSEYKSKSANRRKPGKTTVQEAQLIGRGARYYPFRVAEFTDRYRRKFDNDIHNELRMLEQLYYHSMHNPDYISELTKVLVAEGITDERAVKKRKIAIKSEFKNSALWRRGYIFLNSRNENVGKDVFALADAHAEFDYTAETNIYRLPTREAIETDIFVSSGGGGARVKTEIAEMNLADFGAHIIRTALDTMPRGQFMRIKKIFGNVATMREFILSKKYLGDIKVKIKGSAHQLANLLQEEKARIALFVVDSVLEVANREKTEFYGTKAFKAHFIREIFAHDKVLQLDASDPRADSMQDFDLSTCEWFAQNEIWGTSEEQSCLRFIGNEISALNVKYEQIVLLRNEQFFKIYNFNDGSPFYPDFVMFLIEKNTARAVAYQVFIEPKGDQFLDSKHSFAESKESWKQKLLLEIEKNHATSLRLENKDFRLIGLPFFNEGIQNNRMREKFEEEFKKQLLT